MSRGLSLYLDLVRFLMAATVLVGHAASYAYTGRHFVLWFAPPYMQTAVIGFFVLSGFVIAHVARERETSAAAYASARIARLYSVIIPALIVTAVADAIGVHADASFYAPQGYTGDTDLSDGGEPFRYLASLFLLGSHWFMPSGTWPGTNAPFWTLGYEATYYFAFGAIIFARGPLRLCLVAFGLALAGPAIVILFPVWLIGVYAYRWQRAHRMPAWVAALVLIGSAILLEKVGWFRSTSPARWPLDRATYVDYAEGCLVAFNLVAAASLGAYLERFLSWCSPAIRWLGSITFATYLCHRPLINLFAVVRADAPGTPLQMVWLFGGTFAVVAIVAFVGDRARGALRTRLVKLWARRQPPRVDCPSGVASERRPQPSTNGSTL